MNPVLHLAGNEGADQPHHADGAQGPQRERQDVAGEVEDGVHAFTLWAPQNR